MHRNFTQDIAKVRLEGSSAESEAAARELYAHAVMMAESDAQEEFNRTACSDVLVVGMQAINDRMKLILAQQLSQLNLLDIKLYQSLRQRCTDWTAQDEDDEITIKYAAVQTAFLNALIMAREKQQCAALLERSRDYARYLRSQLPENYEEFSVADNELHDENVDNSNIGNEHSQAQNNLVKLSRRENEAAQKLLITNQFINALEKPDTTDIDRLTNFRALFKSNAATLVKHRDHKVIQFVRFVTAVLVSVVSGAFGGYLFQRLFNPVGKRAVTDMNAMAKDVNDLALK